MLLVSLSVMWHERVVNLQTRWRGQPTQAEQCDDYLTLTRAGGVEQILQSDHSIPRSDTTQYTRTVVLRNYAKVAVNVNMRYSSETFVALAALCLSPLAFALPTPESTPPAHIVWQPSTPKNAWLECLTSRSNGDLLVTRYDTGEIWTVNPITEQATLVYAFPAGANVNSSLGIDEYEDDVFAFNAGQVTPGDRFPIHGTWSVWSIDLKNWTASAANGSRAPSVSRIAKVPEALMLNGLTVLNPATTTGPRAKGNASSPTLLLADSTAGILYSINATANNADQTAERDVLNFSSTKIASRSMRQLAVNLRPQQKSSLEPSWMKGTSQKLVRLGGVAVAVSRHDYDPRS